MNFDESVSEYLETLSRNGRLYAAHVAHHTQAGTLSEVCRDTGSFGVLARERKAIDKRIAAIAATVAQSEEDTAVRNEEDRIERGQADWSETGSTRRS